MNTKATSPLIDRSKSLCKNKAMAQSVPSLKVLVDYLELFALFKLWDYTLWVMF